MSKDQFLEACSASRGVRWLFQRGQSRNGADYQCVWLGLRLLKTIIIRFVNISTVALSVQPLQTSTAFPVCAETCAAMPILTAIAPSSSVMAGDPTPRTTSKNF